MSDSWSGDWAARVKDRARRLGFSGMLEFAAANPGISFGQLFRFLRETESGSDVPIALVQVVDLYFDEAETGGNIRFGVADSLVRSLRQHLRKGWNRGRIIHERRAEARTSWQLPPSRFSEFAPIAYRVWDALANLPPPDDWCPNDANDPVIQRALSLGWPTDAPLP